MRHELPEIARHAMRALACIEEAVTRFPRRHRYGIGADLRSQAMQVARCVHRAWRERTRQLQRVHELSAAVDDLKLTLQLCDAVKAFRSFGEFEVVARLVSDLGRQCGGWLKQLHATGQSGRAGNPPGQRASILSSQAAPLGATL